MQVVFHIGAHCTGQDRLLKSLLKNRGGLAAEGVAVPGPGRYRKAMVEAITVLKGAAAARDGEEALLDAILDGEDADRLILSNDNFICTPNRVLEHADLYARIGKAVWLRNALPSCEAAFAVALRDMGTFLPALYDQISENGEALDPAAFLAGVNPRALRWSEVIGALVEGNPTSEILVWCDEDSPILWPEIMREMTGTDPLFAIEGGNDLVRMLLAEAGKAALDAALVETPPVTEAERRRIVETVLAEHADDAETMQEIALPGWTGALMDDLAAAYEDDVERIARMERVTLLTP